MTDPRARPPYHRDTALHASGLLRAFNDAELLTAADVHVASRVGAAVGETDESALLAVAFAVRAARQGSVCVDLAGLAASPADSLAWPDPGPWQEAVSRSRVAAYGVVHHDLGRLYLDRYWREEVQVADDLASRAGLPVMVDAERLGAALGAAFPGAGYAEQCEAARVCCTHRTAIVTGGPGTGKTTTIARLIASLVALDGPRLRVALAAPTGKAAARITQAVQAETAKSDFPSEATGFVGSLAATTIHRLLGWRPESRNRFRHDRLNPLPHDVVVVDETSMVSLTLLARLLEAVPPHARLVLVGDADQLDVGRGGGGAARPRRRPRAGKPRGGAPADEPPVPRRHRRARRRRAPGATPRPHWASSSRRTRVRRWSTTSRGRCGWWCATCTTPPTGATAPPP